MANVAHASLTGSNLHEPKGVASAASGQVYIANGAGSGTWQTVTGLTFTGMVAPFLAPIAPPEWLELDGAFRNISAYPNLYNTITIQQNGTRVGGLAVISGLASTTGIYGGYYVFGTGIAAGTQVFSVDSSSQITLNANASSSGTSSVHISPWLINATQFQLPDMVTSARYLRSRNNSLGLPMGVYQTNANKAHTHTGTTTSDGAHTHTVNITDPGHFHTPASGGGGFWVSGGGGFAVAGGSGTSAVNTSTATTGISASTVSNGSHTHTFTSSSDGDAESRPNSISMLWCVKT